MLESRESRSSGLTMRDLTKEELAALCFSACKLNLPLVPSQGDVLKDNKRCYDNILSESVTPFRFILVGLMNMIMVCSLATTFFDRHNAVLVSPW